MLTKVREPISSCKFNHECSSHVIQNMVQGSLVNGSIGRVIGFMTTREANDKGVAIGKANGENTVGVPGPRVVPRVAESMIRSNAVWPVVKFQNTVEMLCVPMQFEVNDADGKVEAARGQVSLVCHAISPTYN